MLTITLTQNDGLIPSIINIFDDDYHNYHMISIVILLSSPMIVAISSSPYVPVVEHLAEGGGVLVFGSEARPYHIVRQCHALNAFA